MDVPAFAAGQWRAGDVVISRFVLPWPTAGGTLPATMRLGMYTYPDLTAVPLLDEAGNPAADVLEIPLDD